MKFKVYETDGGPLYSIVVNHEELVNIAVSIGVTSPDSREKLATSVYGETIDGIAGTLIYRTFSDEIRDRRKKAS
jgi:hypothetical protein